MLPPLLLRTRASGPTSPQIRSLVSWRANAPLWADPEKKFRLPHQPLAFLKIGAGNSPSSKYPDSDCGHDSIRNVNRLNFSKNSCFLWSQRMPFLFGYLDRFPGCGWKGAALHCWRWVCIELRARIRTEMTLLHVQVSMVQLSSGLWSLRLELLLCYNYHTLYVFVNIFLFISLGTEH